MSPDTLFDYLDGNLPEQTRRDLEARLQTDAALQRELEVARRIHAGMRATRRETTEVPGELPAADAARGRKLAGRVALAFVVLMAVNVGLGVLYIGYHEQAKKQNPAAGNPQLPEQLRKREAEVREQLQRSLEQSAARELTPAPLGVAETTLMVEPSRAAAAADDVVNLASRFGATATKGIPDGGKVQVMLEIPEARAAGFLSALANLPEIKKIDAGALPAAAGERLTLVIHLTEAK